MGLSEADLTLVLAVYVAKDAHEGQVDKSGEPYINHPRHIAEQFESPELAAVALLHDVLEDTPVTADMLREKFPEHIVQAVLALTRSEHEDYQDFIVRCGQNELARQVKIEDLKHNMDLTRLKTVSEADLKRQAKYEKALIYLEGLKEKQSNETR